MNSAIGNDAPDLDISSPDSGFDAFFTSLVPDDAAKKKTEEQPSPKENEQEEAARVSKDEGKQPDADKADEGTADENQPEPKEGEESAEDQAERKLADDGAYVKVKVGDEEHEVSVKDLQRLYGQEASLTKKSMEVADQRKAVDAKMAENVAASAALLQRAQERFKPYSQIDFNLAAKQLSAEEYTNLRQAAMAAYEDVQFLQNNLTGFMQAAQGRQQETLATQAKECLKVLSGAVDQGGIEGWNEQLYNDVRSFGEKAGLSKDILHNLVDPAAYRVMHDAMLYRRGLEKVTTTRVNKTPTKVVKTSRPSTAGQPDKAKADAARERLQRSGDTDDAANLFMARWADRDAEQQ